MKVTVDKALIEQAIDTIGYYASVCGEDGQDTPAKQAQEALRAALAAPAAEKAAALGVWYESLPGWAEQKGAMP